MAKRGREEIPSETSQLHSWLKELDVEPELLLGELGEDDLTGREQLVPVEGKDGGKPRAPSNHLSTCHGALLLGTADHFVDIPGQRVCPQCQAMCRMGGPGGRGQVFVDKARVRLLTAQIGTWSKARDFYTRWEALPGVNALARRFPLAGAKSGACVIVFKSSEQAQLLDQHLGPRGTLQPLAEDPAFTMCSRAKTFCPCCNFASSAGRGCVMHSTAMRAMRGGAKACKQKEDAVGELNGQGGALFGEDDGQGGALFGEDDLGLGALSPAVPGGQAVPIGQAAAAGETSPPGGGAGGAGGAAPGGPMPPEKLETSMQQEMEALVSLLPAQYVMSTTLHDRLVHLQLLKRLRAQPELQVLSTWTQYTDRVGTQGLRQHLIFRDRPGSLGAVTAVLSRVGVNILEAAVFCTADGYALDIFSLSTPNPTLAKLCDEEICKFFRTPPPSSAMVEARAEPMDDDAPGGALAVFGAAGRQFDSLEIKSQIAEGGMTKVYRGEWQGQRVAVKVLNQGASISPEALRSFAQEVKILGGLRHPAICSFLGACSTECFAPNAFINHDEKGLPAIVLEHLQGGSLHDLLHNPHRPGAGQLPPLLTSRIALEVAQGVAYLHSRQVIHRDVKSANVLLDERQHAKVTDFGISTRFKPDHTAETGTYRYMAPEVIAHQNYDYRCDVYSFGMLLWETTHQEVPFRNQNALQAAFAVAMEQKRPPLGLCPELAGFATLISMCWTARAEHRPDMDRVVRELDALHQAVGGAAAAAEAAADLRALPHAEPPAASGGPTRRSLHQAVGVEFLAEAQYLDEARSPADVDDFSQDAPSAWATLLADGASEHGGASVSQFLQVTAEAAV